MKTRQKPLSRPTTNHAHRSPPPIASALVYLRYYPALSTATNDNNGNGDGDDGDDDDEDENEDDVAIS
uniref:HDC12977 n=1 Tax=Drosophila melanogaster TaxID=7227 RepID=Q6IKB3_DROME|nr:TPA_inf: HDC12977 [Drosophila melanogaster]